MRLSTSMLCAVAACGCQCEERAGTVTRPEPETPAASAFADTALPADPDTFAPMIARDGTALAATWIENVGEAAHRVRFARLEHGVWSTPATVTESERMFANWADFPAVVRADDGTLFAHWGRKSGEQTYAYDVALSRSRDGVVWQEIGAAHDDGTPTEHGFASWLPEGNGARAFWLDGRLTANEGPMTLRTGLVGDAMGESVVLDDRVCDCCQTDAALTDEGPLVVYRDRTEAEIRDIAIVRRLADGSWSEPALVHDDGFHVEGCPVNGPAVAADGALVVVAWYTLGGAGGVRLAFSLDSGRSFGEPVTIDGSTAVGRVDVALAGDGALVSWIAGVDADTAETRVRHVAPDGTLGEPVVVTETSPARSAGVPRIAVVGPTLFVAWTRPSEPPSARVSSIDVSTIPRTATELVAERPVPRATMVGERVPDVSFDDVRSDRTLSLRALGRRTVLSFFATWCAPCRRELPALSRVAATHPDVRVLSVSVDELPADEIREFGARHDIEHDLLLDTGDAAARFGVPPLPATFVIDAAGHITWTHRAWDGGSFEHGLSAALRPPGRAPGSSD